MFIWGDEKEYMARAIHNGIDLLTITSAIHFHPKEKGVKGNVIPFCSKFKILIKPTKLSHYYYRNEGYIYGNYPEKKRLKPLFWMAHVVYNILRFRFKELYKFIVYFHRGETNNFKN
jgi:rhamnopyranosyl-N-acetylglucosaminyl-diphospho-decaprenol beta-1,3/1,4-galactofuranosyltransferase